MNMLLSIIVFIVILGLVVLVHEFGHFIVAKKSGMQVEEFGFGFPPRIWGIKKGETIYSLNAVPLGGFVRILGENNDDQANPRSFINKKFFPRFFTLVAGVLMNLVLAWVLISIGFVIGLPTQVAQGDQLPKYSILKDQSIAVLQVDPGSPAAQVGLKEGDQIISVDGHNFNSIDALAAYIIAQKGHDILMHIMRGNQAMDIRVYARPSPPSGHGATGISIADVGRLVYPWYIAPIKGLQATKQIIADTLNGFYALIRSGQGLNNLGGPIRIAALTNQVTQLGLVYVIQFAAFLSINLAIINILPFPALDGGRVLFLVIEKIRGRRNNQQVEQWANTIGFALLILFVIIISAHDVKTLIGK